MPHSTSHYLSLTTRRFISLCQPCTGLLRLPTGSHRTIITTSKFLYTYTSSLPSNCRCPFNPHFHRVQIIKLPSQTLRKLLSKSTKENHPLSGTPIKTLSPRRFNETLISNSDPIDFGRFASRITRTHRVVDANRMNVTLIADLT